MDLEPCSEHSTWHTPPLPPPLLQNQKLRLTNGRRSHPITAPLITLAVPPTQELPPSVALSRAPRALFLI